MFRTDIRQYRSKGLLIDHKLHKIQVQALLTSHFPVIYTNGWTDWPERPPLSHDPWSDQLSDIWEIRNNKDNQKSKCKEKSSFLFSDVTDVTSVCLWPAYVVDGNVSELLVHGWLIFSAWQEIEGRLRVLIGDIYPNFSCALKIEW